MRRPNDNDSTQSDNFVGFIPDLLNRVSEFLAINYEIKLVSDGMYGAKTAYGNFTGMIGELTRRVSWLIVSERQLR